MNLQPPQSLSVWLRVPLWLAAFLSPTAYVLLVMIMVRLRVSAPSEGFVVMLLCLIPVVALLVCGAGVWRLKTTLGWRVGGLIFTVLAMLLQCGVWFVIIISVIAAAL